MRKIYTQKVLIVFISRPPYSDNKSEVKYSLEYDVPTTVAFSSIKWTTVVKSFEVSHVDEEDTNSPSRYHLYVELESEGVNTGVKV